MRSYVQIYSLFFLLYFVFVQTELPPDQKNTMQNLYESLKHNTTVPWNPSKDPCSWKEINCSLSLYQSYITQISLSSSSSPNSDSLIGMCNIITLESIDFSENPFSSIPEWFITSCGELTGLRILNYSMNSLVGSLPTFVGFENLEILDLSFGSLSGNISSQLGGLDSLRIVNLGFNSFTGSLPTQLGKQNVLEELYLSFNQFQGRIPEEIGNYWNLVSNDLSKNMLSGSVTNQVGELWKGTNLIRPSNNLSGDISGNNIYGNNTYVTTGPDPPLHRKTKTSVKGIVFLTVAAVFLSILIVAVAIIFVPKCYHKPNEQQIQSQENFSLAEIICGTLLTRNSLHRSNIDFSKAMELVNDPSNIVLKTKFSTYYKATMPSGSNYFVKRLNWGERMFQSGSHDRFREEFQALSKLNNSNIMTPLAYVLTVDIAFIFYEYSRMGTLFDALHNRNMGKALDWVSRYNIAIGVAQGLAYIHEYGSDPILLLDLSSTSVLLRSHKEPRIGDIELWKIIDPANNTASLSAVAGTVGYIPPEYAYTMRVTMAGNVYSLGVILLELLTGRPALSQGIVLAKWAPLIIPKKQKNLDHILDKDIGGTSLAVKKQMLAVLKVALACVTDSPYARPDTKTVVRMLLSAR